MHNDPVSEECAACGVYLDGDDACRACLTWIAATRASAVAERARGAIQVDILLEHLATRRLLRPAVDSVAPAGRKLRRLPVLGAAD